jgi:hypothetical protein
VSGVSHPFTDEPSQFPKSALHVPSVHDPLAQLSVAFGRSQVVPQPPQFMSEVSAVSHPFASTASQLPRPASHDEIAQVPVLHVAVAPGREQAVPQAPQSVSVRIERSQPFEASPSQSSNPVVHAATWQLPVAQLSVAFASSQVSPQPAQFERVVSGVSQPVVALPSQLPKPDEHVPSAQLPVAQLSLAFA